MPGRQVKKRPVLSPEERKAKHAQTVEQKIVKGCMAVRAVWVALAAYLHEFHSEAMWEDLDYETFEDWLGSPEIGLSRSHVYALIQCHEELVILRQIPAAELEGIDATKVQQVLPALKRGDVEVDQALADARSLSRADLRKEYGGKKRSQVGENHGLITCDQCGLQREPRDPDTVGDAPIPGQTKLT